MGIGGHHPWNACQIKKSNNRIGRMIEYRLNRREEVIPKRANDDMLRSSALSISHSLSSSLMRFDISSALFPEYFLMFERISWSIIAFFSSEVTFLTFSPAGSFFFMIRPYYKFGPLLFSDEIH